MNKPVVVLAAAIRNGTKYLLTRRPGSSCHNPGRWEFPGGKLEFGESFHACMKREIREELGLEIIAGNVFGISSYVYNESHHIVLIGLLCTVSDETIRLQEIEEYRWVSVEEMSRFDITEADLPLVDALRTGGLPNMVQPGGIT